MMYKPKLKIVGAVAIAAVFCVGCDMDIGGVATPAKTTFTDDRDGKTYDKVKIGSQVWMAENLNYATDVSVARSRRYNWAMAMDIDNSYNHLRWNGSDVHHQGVCPDGWHLPSDSEWARLEKYVGGWAQAGKRLKARDGWPFDKEDNKSGNGTDDYGFSALPGGLGGICGVYGGAGYGLWWSATEDTSGNFAKSRSIGYAGDAVMTWRDVKTCEFSVRCVQD